MTDEEGKEVWSSEYTPFGDKHSVTGELDHATKFTGKDLDEDTGLYYFNARWYDSELGRFISEDPGRDPNSPNLYTYCANNPLTYIDLDGKVIQLAIPAWAMVYMTAVLSSPDLQSDVEQLAYDLGSGDYASAAGSFVGIAFPGVPSRITGAATKALTKWISKNSDTVLKYLVGRNPAGIVNAAKTMVENGKFSNIDEALSDLFKGKSQKEIQLIKNRAAGSVGEGFLAKNYGGKQQVIKNTSRGRRVIDNLVDGVAMESKVGRTGLTKRVKGQIAKDVELMNTELSGVEKVQWHFFESKSGAGPTDELRKALKDANIEIVEHVKKKE